MSEYIMYLRKSRQDDPNTTVEEVLNKHEKDLQDYAVRTIGYRIPEKDIYREIVSGETIEDRPEINKIFKRIEGDEVKGVLVIEPQRLTRGDLLDCGTVVHVFRFTHTLIVTPTKTYDLEDKYDRKFLEMELTRGNDYLEYTKEILARGRRRSALDGNFIASHPPYGYNRIKLDTGWSLAINEEEAEYVKLIFKWHNNGLGLSTIAHRLNDMGAKPRIAERFEMGTIRFIITNEAYIGKIRFQHRKVVPVYENGKLVKKNAYQNEYTVVDGKHQAIIDEETFYKAQEIRGSIVPKKWSTELKNIYAGILRCKKCGKALNYTTYDGQKARNGKPPRYQCRGGKYCDNKSSHAYVVQDVIQKTLKATLQDYEFKLNNDTRELLETHENVLKSLEKQLEELEVRQEQLYDYLEKKLYTPEVFLKRNEKLAEERESLKTSIEKTKATMPTVKEYENKVHSLHECLDMLSDDSVPALAKNMFLKGRIDTITYEKNGKNVEDIAIEIFLK